MKGSGGGIRGVVDLEGGQYEDDRIGSAKGDTNFGRNAKEEAVEEVRVYAV